jgi:translation elongation factor EF-Ts
MLRALGILSSSAAGEMLAKPGEEFAKVKADLTTAFNKRKGQVDDWLKQRLQEADNSKNQVTQQFNDIIANINIDRRFNQKDKIGAVQQAQAALTGRIAELNQQAMSWQQVAQQYSQNLQMQIAQFQLYQNPKANISGILSSAVTPQTTAYKPIQVGTLQPEKKDQYGNLLSG